MNYNTDLIFVSICRVTVGQVATVVLHPWLDQEQFAFHEQTEDLDSPYVIS